MLNPSPPPSDDHVVVRKKKIKSIRARESHREIEKRRRDRMNKSLAQLRSLIPDQVAQFWEKKKLEKLDVIEMAVEHLTRMKTYSSLSQDNSSPYRGHGHNRNDDFSSGYNYCLKGVSDYFHLTNLSDNTISASHLMTFLEHRLTFEPIHEQVVRHHHHHQNIFYPRQVEQRSHSSCEHHSLNYLYPSQDVIPVSVIRKNDERQSTNEYERSESPEKRRRSDGGGDGGSATLSSPTTFSSPSPNLANLTINDDTPLNQVIDLATSTCSSSSSSTCSEERRRQRSTSFKKVLKERYLKGSRSE